MRTPDEPRTVPYQRARDAWRRHELQHEAYGDGLDQPAIDPQLVTQMGAMSKSAATWAEFAQQGGTLKHVV